MTDRTTIESRIQRLEDIESIRKLVALYPFLVDDRDFNTLEALLTENFEFLTADGTSAGSGRAAAIKAIRGRVERLGACNHFVHEHVIDIEPGADVASGRVNAHSEVIRDGIPMVTSFRYADTYRREDGRWRFSSRRMSFFYYVDASKYAEQLLGGVDGTLRNHSVKPAVAADHPESAETYRQFYSKNKSQHLDV